MHTSPLMMSEAFPHPPPLDNHFKPDLATSHSASFPYNPASPHGALRPTHLRAASKTSLNGSPSSGGGAQTGAAAANGTIDTTSRASDRFHDDRLADAHGLTRRTEEASPKHLSASAPSMSTASPSAVPATLPPSTAGHATAAPPDTPSSRGAPPPPLPLHMHPQSHAQEQGGSYVASPTHASYPHPPSASQAWMEAPRSAPYYGYPESHRPHAEPRHHTLSYSSEGAPPNDERANGPSSRGSAEGTSGPPDAPTMHAIGDESEAAENGVGEYPSSGYSHLPRSHSVPAEYGHGQHLQHHHAPHASFSHYPPAYMHPQYMQQFHYPPPPASGANPDHPPPTTTQPPHAQQRYAYMPYGFPPTTLAMSMAPQNMGLYYQAPHPHQHPQPGMARVDPYGMHHQHGHPAHDGHVGRHEGDHNPYGGVAGARGQSSSASSSNAIAPGEVDPAAQPPTVDGKQPKLTKSGKPRLPRQLISCDFCRMRKLRCDGQRPCGHCARRSRECVYQESVRKRGKGKKSKDKDSDDRLSGDMGSYDVSSGSISQQDIAGGTLIPGTEPASMATLATTHEAPVDPAQARHEAPESTPGYWHPEGNGAAELRNSEWGAGHEEQGRWNGAEGQHSSAGYNGAQAIDGFPSASYPDGQHQL